jgi:hypothetical protein
MLHKNYGRNDPFARIETISDRERQGTWLPDETVGGESLNVAMRGRLPPAWKLGNWSNV